MSDGTQNPANEGSVNLLNADADVFHIEHFEIGENGLQIDAALLNTFGFTSLMPVSMMICEGQLVITNHSAKCALMSSAEELQLRQDETKADHNQAIRSLLGIACALPPVPNSGFYKHRR
ncbi:hypothetical protein [Alteromonas sp. a30]|uniref:hypothetical protein n=1 Tax=Alteromonas sp. a30 TaxID=2730917 RepID=UPI002282CED2|nr:hypothetical protein [Alteromonas sp. a30]MCY7296275.1 hypothetical protein [Alteromonas sp. a30]